MPWTTNRARGLKAIAARRDEHGGRKPAGADSPLLALPWGIDVREEVDIGVTPRDFRRTLGRYANRSHLRCTQPEGGPR